MKATNHLLVYLFCGAFCVAFIYIGHRIYPTDQALSSVLFHVAVALGPVTLLGIIYQYFLFKEIRDGARDAFTTELQDKLSDMEILLDDNKRLVELGIVRIYALRSEAFREVEDWLSSECNEIFFVGTSLRGVLGKEEGSSRIRDLIKQKTGESVACKFLLTHPAFSILREKYENVSRKPENSVAREILETIDVLRQSGVPASNIKFFCGTPTCFGIKTTKYMLLNPYAYQNQAYRSFCAVVSKEGGRGDIYQAYDESHFKGVWRSANVVDLKDFEEKTLGDLFRADIISVVGAFLGSDTSPKGLPSSLAHQ